MGEAEVGAKLTALGNALSGIVVVDGRIVGTWKRTLSSDSVVVETDLLTSVTERDDRAIVAAAERYAEYLELPLVTALASGDAPPAPLQARVQAAMRRLPVRK